MGDKKETIQSIILKIIGFVIYIFIITAVKTFMRLEGAGRVLLLFSAAIGGIWLLWIIYKYEPPKEVERGVIEREAARVSKGIKNKAKYALIAILISVILLIYPFQKIGIFRVHREKNSYWRENVITGNVWVWNNTTNEWQKITK